MIVGRAAATLAAAGVENARVDAEWIVAHVAGVRRSELVAVIHKVDEEQVDRLVARRARREPLAYVLGEWGFRRLTLTTDARALVPRPETEALVERALTLLGGRDAPRVLDVGTGSGAVALALADEAGAEVVATDVSAEALALAAENVERTGLRVELVRADVREGLPAGPFDLVVSNPPYVLAEEWERLEPEVRDAEPRLALVEDGQTDALVRSARDVLRAGGALAVEVHVQRAADVARALEDAGYDAVTIGSDLAGRDRIVDGVTR